MCSIVNFAGWRSSVVSNDHIIYDHQLVCHVLLKSLDFEDSVLFLHHSALFSQDDHKRIVSVFGDRWFKQ